MAKERKSISHKTQLLLLAIPFVLFIILFYYVPLAGWSIAFFRYIPGLPLSESRFVGFDNFIKIFSYGSDFLNTLKNTFAMSFLNILISPAPMLFAILLNEVGHIGLKKTIQTGSTLPHFISYVIVYSIFMSMFSFDDGFINILLRKLNLTENGFNPLVMKDLTWFFQAVIITIWKNLGWSSIVYIAAIASIPQELYEASEIDGANRLQQTLHITIPSLMPTYMVLLILNIGHLLNGTNFQQIFVFYNPIVASRIETLDYYVYRIGLVEFDFSLSTAIGVFKSVVSVTLLFSVNGIGKKILGRSVI